MNGPMNVNQKLFLTTCLTQGGENLIDTGQILVKLQEYFYCYSVILQYTFKTFFFKLLQTPH